MKRLLLVAANRMKGWLARKVFKTSANRFRNQFDRELGFGRLAQRGTGLRGVAANGSPITTIIIVLAMFVAVFIAVIVSIFLQILCMLPFGMLFTSSCESTDKTKTAILDKELDSLADRMIEARLHVNRDGDIEPGYEGEEYGSEGRLPTQNYRQYCGPYTGEYSDIINKYAEEFGVDAQLIAAIIQTESSFNPEAVSHAGAKGLMQLMPGTAKEMGVNDPFDPDQSIKGGTGYIRKMIDLRGGDLELALASYNWGPGNVKNAMDSYGSSWSSIKPFAPTETQNYVTKVMTAYENFGKDSGSCAGAAGGSSTRWQNGVSEKITEEHLDEFFGDSHLKYAGTHIVKYAKEYSMDPVFIAAIMMHETGNGTDYKASHEYYNFGGIKCASEKAQNEFGFTCKKGTGNSTIMWSKFPSMNKGVQYMTYLLRTYADSGLDTVGSVQERYCPNNDSGCENWQSGVNSNIDKIYQIAGVQRPYNGISQPTQDEVIGDISVGVFPLPKDKYDEFSDTWGAEREGGKRSHEGTDILAPKGTEIYSATDGVVVKKGWNQYGGWTYLIQTGELQIYYAHLSKYVGDNDGKRGIKVGDRVNRGQLIGYVGNTGGQNGVSEGTEAAGPTHLHLGIYRDGEALNPYPTLKKWEGNFAGVSGNTVVDTALGVVNSNGGFGTKTDFCFARNEDGIAAGSDPCRDFVQTVFKDVNIELEGSAAKQFASEKGKNISVENVAGSEFADEELSLQPGDVLFFGDKDVPVKEGSSKKKMLEKSPDYYVEKNGVLYGVKYAAIYLGTEDMKRKILLIDDNNKFIEATIETDWMNSQLIGAKRYTSSLVDDGRVPKKYSDIVVTGHLSAKQEALVHIGSLIQTDRYALAGTGIKEKPVEDLEGKIEQEPEIDKIIEEKYKGTYVDKTWQMVKEFRQRLKNNPFNTEETLGLTKNDIVKWTLEEEFINLRLVAYRCYLAGDDTGFLKKNDKPCEFINKLYADAMGTNEEWGYITEDFEGVLQHIEIVPIEIHRCVPADDGDDDGGGSASSTSSEGMYAEIESAARSKEVEINETFLGGLLDWLKETFWTGDFPTTRGETIVYYKECGPGEVKEIEYKEIRTVKYPLLIEDALFTFDQFSLIVPGVTSDKDESFRDWVVFYLKEFYKANGAQFTIGGGYGEAPGGNIMVPSSGIFKSPFAPDAHGGLWTITSEYGPRNGGMHKGIDIAFYHSAPGVGPKGSGPWIHAIGGGTVSFAGNLNGYGYVVFIDHDNGYSSRYAHMIEGSISVQVGQRVEVGAPLGRVGTTGNSTGPHLHLDICKDGAVCKNKIDPRLVIKLPAKGQAAKDFNDW